MWHKGGKKIIKTKEIEVPHCTQKNKNEVKMRFRKSQNNGSFLKNETLTLIFSSIDGFAVDGKAVHGENGSFVPKMQACKSAFAN